MAFFVYIAIVLVSIAGILLELDWLTKPKSETRSPVQVATRTVAPPPQANAKGQSADLTPVNPKNPDIPQSVKKPDTPQADETVHDAVARPPAAPQPPAANANASAVTSAQVEHNPAAATKDVPPPAQRADGSTAGRALADTRALAYSAEPPPAPAAAVVAPAPAIVPPAAQTHTVAAAPNRCDVQACSSAYQSFRASDCTYQPFEGPRRACDSPPAIGRATASQPRAEPRRQATYRTRDDDVDRDVIVRRVRPIDADDDDTDEVDDRGMARSRVIVIERPPRSW